MDKMKKCYRLIDHTADVAIEVIGDDMKSLFTNCGYALFDILYDTDSIRSVNSYDIKAIGSTKEELLINFLRELFFKYAVYKVVLNEIDIKNLTDDTVTASARGEEFVLERHELNMDIKAVTYHNVKIKEEGGKLKVSIVFDT